MYVWDISTWQNFGKQQSSKSAAKMDSSGNNNISEMLESYIPIPDPIA